MKSLYKNHSDMTEEEIAATERVRALLLNLGRAIMDDAETIEARKALESEGTTLAAKVTAPNEVMVVASYGRLRLPVLAATNKAAHFAALFLEYKGSE